MHMGHKWLFEDAKYSFEIIPWKELFERTDSRKWIGLPHIHTWAHFFHSWAGQDGGGTAETEQPLGLIDHFL